MMHTRLMLQSMALVVAVGIAGCGPQTIRFEAVPPNVATKHAMPQTKRFIGLADGDFIALQLVNDRLRLRRFDAGLRERWDVPLGDAGYGLGIIDLYADESRVTLMFDSSFRKHPPVFVCRTFATSDGREEARWTPFVPMPTHDPNGFTRLYSTASPDSTRVAYYQFEFDASNSPGGSRSIRTHAWLVDLVRRTVQHRVLSTDIGQRPHYKQSVRWPELEIDDQGRGYLPVLLDSNHISLTRFDFSSDETSTAVVGIPGVDFRHGVTVASEVGTPRVVADRHEARIVSTFNSTPRRSTERPAYGVLTASVDFRTSTSRGRVHLVQDSVSRSNTFYHGWQYIDTVVLAPNGNLVAIIGGYSSGQAFVGIDSHDSVRWVRWEERALSPYGHQSGRYLWMSGDTCKFAYNGSPGRRLNGGFSSLMLNDSFGIYIGQIDARTGASTDSPLLLHLRKLRPDMKMFAIRDNRIQTIVIPDRRENEDVPECYYASISWSR